MEKYLTQMDSILAKLFAKYSQTLHSPGMLLSGGIDSSTVSYLVSQYFQNYSIFSMGTGKTKDREYIDIICNKLNHSYDWVEISEDKIENNMKTIDSLLKQAGIEISMMQRSLAMGYFLLFEEVKKAGVTHIFTGQGPDILLAGYHKYESVKNINREIEKDLPFLEIDKKRDSAMARYFGVTLINPYLSEEFIEFSLSIPQEYKMKEGVEKYILREYARTKGIPDQIVRRPKKAFQYSTGIQSLINNMYYHVK